MNPYISAPKNLLYFSLLVFLAFVERIYFERLTFVFM